MFWAFTLQPQNLNPNAAVNVPDVSGLSWEEGSQLLEDAGLRPEKVEVVNPDVEENIIIDTDPQADLDVTPGFRITVNVSSGAATVPVPDVANKAQGDAVAAIEAAGLKVGAITSTYSSGVPNGVVISTNPEGGATQLPAPRALHARELAEDWAPLAELAQKSGRSLLPRHCATASIGLFTDEST